MRVLFVASEVYPLVKTGGLADVSRALPMALARMGVDVRLLLPAYPCALEQLSRRHIEASFDEILGVPGGRLIAGHLPNTDLPVWLVDAPGLFDRDGGPYQDAEGRDWPDNALRFAYFAHVGARIATGLTETGWRPDIVHANDWHTGLVPLLLAEAGPVAPKSIFTIHNLAFQGNFPADALAQTGLEDRHFDADGVEFFGQVSFLKSGLRFADQLTTVSPTYAKEVRTPEYGCGMDGLLQARSENLRGILNGVEYGVWEPACDPYIASSYNASSVAGKKVCKAALQAELGLPVDPDVPLLGFVSRITDQKMADVVLEALPWLAEQGAQFVLVGQGDPALQRAFAEAGRRHSESIAIHIGYEESLAHRLQAGADILLAPSRFEPCGLTQLYAMRYGTLPVVRRTGGLADSVVDATPQAISQRIATGFVFDDPDLEAMQEAISRALDLYHQPLTWRRLQLQAMQRDFGWDASAGAYVDLYREVAGLPIPVAKPTHETECEDALAHVGEPEHQLTQTAS
jgi:starch synthase